jgi:quinol monooxygenase YgiN
MIVLVASFEFPAASRARVLELARHMNIETNAEAGWLHYRHALDVSDPQRLILSEVWRDSDALSAHFRSPHFRAFRGAARELGIRSKVLTRGIRSAPWPPSFRLRCFARSWRDGPPEMAAANGRRARKRRAREAVSWFGPCRQRVSRVDRGVARRML